MATKGYAPAISAEDDVEAIQRKKINPNLVRAISLIIVLAVWQVYGMNVNPLFFAGVLMAAVGAGMVLYFRPQA